MSHPSSKEEKDDKGYTALHYAVLANDIKTIRNLIAQGLDKETKDNFGDTPLMLAAREGRIGPLINLIEAGCNLKVRTERSGNSIFTLAACNNNLEVLEYLLTLKEINVNEMSLKGDTALSNAAGFERFNKVHFLLRRGGYIDSLMSNGNTPRREVEQALIESEEINPTLDKLVTLLKASETLIQRVDENSKESFEEIFTTLNGAINGRRIKDGNTALNIAAIKDSVPLIIMLLEKGADVSLANHDGVSAAMLLEHHKEPYIRVLVFLSKLRTLEQEIYQKEKNDQDRELIRGGLPKREYKLSMEAQGIMKSILQNMQELSPNELRKISFSLMKIISEQNAPFFQLDLTKTLLQQLIRDLESPERLTKQERDRTVFTILRLASYKLSPFYDEKLLQELFTTMKMNYIRNGEEAFSLLNKEFKEEQVVFCSGSGASHAFQKNVYMSCYVRVPPKTFLYSVTLTPQGEYETRISDDQPKIIKHTSLDSVHDHMLATARKKVAQLRASYIGIERAQDIKRTAEWRESSIRALSGSQREAMDAIRHQYKEKLKSMGNVEGVIKNFIDYLETEYNKNPPQYKGMKLPLKYDPKLFERPRQSSETDAALREHLNDVKIISELYYTNPIHTAWRYFLNPNPWIDPNAQYGIRTETESGTVVTHAEISDKAREDLAYLWLAASDTSIVPIRDMTVSDMMQLFTNEIAYINRGHNWDELDAIAEGPEKRKITEEMVKKYGKIVDDLRSDNPSCNQGVNQRLMQSVLGNPITETPETRILDPKIARDYIIDFITSRFNKYLSTKDYAELKKLRDIFNKKYIEMEALTKTQQALFDEFHLTQKGKNKILTKMQELFGDRLLFIEIQVGPGEHYTCYEEYVRKLISQNPYETFYERLSGILEKTIKSKETKLEKEGKIGERPVRTLVSHWETKVKEGKEKEVKEKKGKGPKSPKNPT